MSMAGVVRVFSCALLLVVTACNRPAPTREIPSASAMEPTALYGQALTSPDTPVCFAEDRMTVVPSSRVRALPSAPTPVCGTEFHYAIDDCGITVLVDTPKARTPGSYMARFGPNGVPVSELPAAFGIRPRAIVARDPRLTTIRVADENDPAFLPRGAVLAEEYVVFEQNGLGTRVHVNAEILKGHGERVIARTQTAEMARCKERVDPWLNAFFASLRLVHSYVHLSEIQIAGAEGLVYRMEVPQGFDSRVLREDQRERVELYPTFEFGAPEMCASFSLGADASEAATPVSGCHRLQALGESWNACPEPNPTRPSCMLVVARSIHDLHRSMRITGNDTERAQIVAALSHAIRELPSAGE